MLLRWAMLLLIGSAVLWFVQRGPSNSSRTSGNQPVVDPRDFSDLSPEMQQAAQAFLALEAREKAVLASDFGVELEARAWEDRITERWDALNQGQLASQVFELAPQGSLSFPVFWEPSPNLPPGVEDLTGVLSGRNWSGIDWPRRVKAWEAEGWRIAHSEWRLSGYQSPGDPSVLEDNQTALSAADPRWETAIDLPRTEIDWVLLIERNGGDDRILARGLATVSWQASSPYLPVNVRIHSWHVFRCQSPPPFRPVAVLDIPVPRETPFSDPVVVTDFDGNGLPDVVWVGAGQWLQIRDGSAQWTALKAWPRQRIWAAAVADLDKDGWDDLVLAGRDGLRWIRREPDKPWEGPGVLLWRAPEPLRHPQVLTVGDMDGDGWPDVYIGQYKLPYLGGQFPTPYYDALDGFPGYLLRHPGTLIGDPSAPWEDVTEAVGLGKKRFRRTYSASWLDINADGTLDLILVSDFAGLDVFLNDGKGRLVDVTDQLGDARHAFGMGHVIGDFLADNRPSLWMLGMDSAVARRLDQLGLGRSDAPDHQRHRAPMTLGNRLYRSTPEGYAWTAASDLARAGWAWGAAAVDIANRGQIDFFVSNGHETRAGTQDYERHFWAHDIYVASSRNDPIHDAFFRSQAGRRAAAHGSYGGWQHQAFFWNIGDGNYREMAWLLGVSWTADGRQVISDDWNQDGRMDLLLTTQEDWPKPRQRVILWENALSETGSWIGFRFPEGSGARSPLNSRVEIQIGDRKRSIWCVSGDSFRTQHRAQAHFGLGAGSRVDSVRVLWADGSVSEFDALPINQWHSLPRSTGDRLDD